MSARASRGLFVVALGVLWIALSLILPLSRTVTAVLAALALVAAVAASLVIGQGGENPEQGGLGKRWRGLSYRTKVNAIAGLMALLAFVGVSIALLEQPIPEQSSGKVAGETTRTTTSTKEEGEGKDGKSNKTLHTEVIAETEPVAEADESLLGRAIDNSAGVVLVRLGLALLAAFIVGLVVQRILRGKYAMTLPFGLGGVPEITEAQTTTVTKEVLKDKALNSALTESKESGPEPDLALVDDLRMKIIMAAGKAESELRAKAQNLPSVDAEAPIGQVIDGVAKETDLGQNGQAAIQGFIDIGAQVAAGAELEPGVERWVEDVGQHLPAAIESL